MSSGSRLRPPSRASASGREGRSGWWRTSRTCSAAWPRARSGWISPNGCWRRTATRPGWRRPGKPVEDILAIIFIFGGMSAIALSFSPVGRALADRIRGKSAGTSGDELRAEVAEHKQAIADELEAMRRELGELAERVDFTERLLAQQREGQRI